ncbi:RICIN domain-containing protein [Streptomyces sp. MB09-02B]|uniref:RICIN domain-containing protein n=1 Tax=Streptomyces sp. MB09-02B TaxID=3028667 RepID=UPI0029A1C016|nr:RICIN domain-containing protein [Streptomyces sp. MB09-02B]MDX3638775.1 RICIN domain-containing protein [Streptomyces sp. MB09-02B]
MTTYRRLVPRATAAALCALAVVLASIVLIPAQRAYAAGSTYYVSETGSDSNSGTSTSAPWRSLSKVNSTTFQPGDTIRFEAGDSWTGQLWPKGSGVDGAPISIDSYGAGAKPKIAGQGTVADAVRLNNQQYWEIRNLDVSNTVPTGTTDGSKLGDFRGIGVHGDNGQTLRHFVIDSVDVHDVTGEVKWIGGSSTGNKPGITFVQGWDRSKNTGGIAFLTGVQDITAPGAPTVLDGITVENSTIKNTSFGGIVVKQYVGDAPGAVATGWGRRATASDSNFTPHTNVTIRGNYITQENTPFGCNGVYLTNVRGGLVEGNVIDRVGVSGVETYMADSVTVQYNEIMGTRLSSGGADQNGMDPDIGTTNQVFQYNYLHDNGDGILLCACNSTYKFGSVVLRYNVITGSTRWNIHMSQQSGTVAQIYNNVFANTDSSTMVTGGVSGKATFTNNLFISGNSAPEFRQQSSIVYKNNGYSSNLTTRPASDVNAVVGAPQFVNAAVAGPYGDENGPKLGTAANFALQAGSVFADAGAAITNNGGLDLNGTPVPTGSGPDIGAFERGATDIAFTDSFDGQATGALADGTNGWQVVSTNNQVAVAETPSATDKSVRLSRTIEGGGTDGTNLARVFGTPLQGVVTVEAQVMRNDTQAGWFGLPYVYDSSGAPAVSVAFARGEIRAYEGSTARVIGTYASGQWYRVTLTVDTVNQRFDLDIDGRRALSDAAFRTSMPGIAKVAWYANGGERGSVHVDDVRVRRGAVFGNDSHRRLVARHSDKCADVTSASAANGAQLIQYSCDTGQNQQWQLRDAGSGYVQLVARHSGKCASVTGASTANGAELIQSDCGNGQNQQWQLRDAGSGHAQLVARHSGKCADVASASAANGAQLIQYSCGTGQNQQWSVSTLTS